MRNPIPITIGFNKEAIGYASMADGITFNPEHYKLEGGFEYDEATEVWRLIEISIVPRLESEPERVK